LNENSKLALVPGAASIANPGYVGKNLGLTVPGPDRSYMSARIDCSVYLPFDASVPGAAEDALRQVDEMINQHIADDAKACQEFFESYKRR
jgi:hypothetical protein